MPDTMAELRDATALPALPPDPWGRPFAVELGDRLTVISRGPDGQLDTEDDAEMLSTNGGGSRWSASFRYHGVPAHNPDGAYRALLQSRGVD